MAKRAPNPQTAYGRKRLREDTQKWKANLSPEERAKVESFSYGWTIFIVAIIMLVIFLVSGGDGLLKWMGK